MRSYLLPFITVLLLIAIPLYPAEKMIIAVLDLKAEDIPKRIARMVSSMLRTQFVNIGKFTVIERSQMDKILKEQGFQYTGCTDKECAVKVGKLMSARKILIGSVGRLGDNFMINVRIVDVEKGNIDFAEMEKAASESMLDTAVLRITERRSHRIEGKQIVKQEIKPLTKPEPPAASLPHERRHQKTSWYIGFGIGSGSAEYEGDSLDVIARDLGAAVPVAERPITLNFGLGAILNPNLHIGVDASVLKERVTDEPIPDVELISQINNYLLSATFFPMGEGLSLKAGFGRCDLFLEIYAPGGDESERYGGWSWLVGVGYQFWLGEHFNLGIHLEYSKQSYDDSDAPDDSEFFNVYVSFYLF